MFLLLYLGHEFGISENFRIMCAADGAGEINEFFKFDWVSGGWNLMVALGAVFGGYLAAHYFIPVDGNIAHVSQATVNSPVSYTHLTPPTSDLVEISVVAVTLKKKIHE